MCGIYGCVSNNNVIHSSFEILKNLEYRGYDSSGIAYIENNNLKYKKSAGKITQLENQINKNLYSNCAILHTRWATHGQANNINAHPHISNNQKIALVHNGIIENYAQLKQEYNIKCKSQTDSEVIVQLLQISTKTNNLEKMQEVCNLLKGSYALAVIFENQPNTIYVAKNKSPVIIGYSNNSSFVCSDINAVSHICTSITILEDKQFAVLTSKGIELFDNKLNQIKGKITTIEHNITSNSTAKFKHNMLKEIYEVPLSIKNTVNNNTYNTISKTIKKLNLKCIENIILIGCGTAYHACLVGEMLFNQNNICAHSYIASEFRYNKINIPKNTLAIFISQSGETADTLACVEKCKKLRIKTLAITNVQYSSITKMANQTLYTFADKEIAVASTKAYSCQITIMHLLNNFLKMPKNNIKSFENTSKNIKKLTKYLLNKHNVLLIKKLAYELKDCKNYFLIGRLGDSITAKESALKIKEITYNQCNAYPSGELKHGTIALIDKNSTVICFATKKKILSKSLIALEEVKSRGAKTILITQQNFIINENDFDKVIRINNIPDIYSEILAIELMQLFSYFLCIELGYDPDKPRNLAKSVTVE